jgi:DNA-directed RNA polymerase specialized sigma24 family protein
LIQSYYFVDQSIAQIAKDNDINEQTVKSRLHRSRKKIKATLIKGGYPA